MGCVSQNHLEQMLHAQVWGEEWDVLPWPFARESITGSV